MNTRFLFTTGIALFHFLFFQTAFALAEMEVLWSAAGGQTSAGDGTVVAQVGDVNNDGFDDILVGQPKFNVTGFPSNTDAGRVLLYYGSSTGFSSVAGWSANGSGAGDQFGYAIAGVGDVNNDGFDDFVVGSPYYDGLGVDEGKVTLFLGSNSSTGPDAGWTMTGGVANTNLGMTVAALGNANGDSFSDFLVGAPNFDIQTMTSTLTNAGRVWLVFGGTGKGFATQIYNGEKAYDQFGMGLTAIGNVTGDRGRLPEFAVGAPGYDVLLTGGALIPNIGRIYCYSTEIGVPSPLATKTGPGMDAALGGVLTSAYGLKKGGKTYVVAGMPTYQGLGQVKVFSVAKFLTSYSIGEVWSKSGTSGSLFGASVAGVGDVNGDSYGDIAVGAPGENGTFTGAGKAHVFLGLTNGSGPASSAAYSLEGEMAGAQFGTSVAAAGDLNGDLRPDLLVNANGHTETITGEGKSYLYSFAPDLRFSTGTPFTLNLSHSYSYLLNQGENVTADFVLNTNFGRYDVNKDYDARVDLIMMRPGHKVPVSIRNLDTVRVLASEAANRGFFYPIGNVPKKEFTLPISGNGYESWFTSNFQEGYFLVVKITLDTADEIFEDAAGELNNYEFSDSFHLFPLTGDLHFGPVTTELNSAIIENNSASCSLGTIPRWFTGGFANWLPGPAPNWDPVNAFWASSLCTDLVADGNAFDMVVQSGGVGTPTVTGHLNGLEVSVSGTSLHSNGVTPGELNVLLPEGHTVHGPSTFGPHPFAPGGSRVITIPAGGLSLPNKADFSTLSGSFSTSPGYLHAIGLPFVLELNNFAIDNLKSGGGWGSYYYIHHHQQFAIEDPRSRRGNITNDLHFTELTGGTEYTYSIDPNGLDVPQMVFEDNRNIFPTKSTQRTHYPNVATSWDSFSIAVANGRVATDKSPSRRKYLFDMNGDCGGCQSGGDDTAYNLFMPYGYGMGSDAAVIGRVTGPQGTGVEVSPAWGPVFSSSGERIFTRRNDDSIPGIFYLPGFEAIGTDNDLGTSPNRVVRYLMGSRDGEDAGSGVVAPGRYYASNETQAKRGNFYTAGLTMGPESHSVGENMQPQLGVGETLDSTVTTIAFGGAAAPEPRNIIANRGTRYVVRPGGLTGVFNTATVPERPRVYGYDLDLRRFAFRQVNNSLDPYSWIDGSVYIGKKGDFTISFSSLALECSGNVAEGLVDRDWCDDLDAAGDPKDTNQNGPIDENCNEHLAYWKTPFELQSMAFESVPPPEDICIPTVRELGVGGVVNVQALDDPLGIYANWSPLGEPSNSRVTSSKDFSVDRPESFDGCVGAACEKDDDTSENQAFPYAASSLEIVSDNNSGWFEFKGKVGVPFWDMIGIDARLANQSYTSQKQSYFMKPGLNLMSLPESQLGDAMRDNTVAAQYSWGSTNFGFALPVYFQQGRHEGKKPRFLGKTKSKDLVGLEVSASADYVDPVRTKASFGASADISEMKELLSGALVDLHVDINDPQSVQRIDSFLNSIGVSGMPVGDVVNEIRDQLSLINVIQDANLDDLMNDAVREGLVGLINGVDPGLFSNLSAALEEVRGLPEVTANAISDKLTEAMEDLLSSLTGPLDELVLKLYQQMPERLAYEYAQPSPDFSFLQQYLDTVSDLASAISTLNNEIDSVKATLSHTENEVNTLIGNAGTDILPTAKQHLGLLISTLEGISDTCGAVGNAQDSGGNQIIDSVFSKIAFLQTDLSNYQDTMLKIDLVTWAYLISAVTGVDLTAVLDAQTQIQNMAEDLGTELDSLNTQFNGQLSSICTALDDSIGDSSSSTSSPTLIGTLKKIDVRLDDINLVLTTVRSNVSNSMQDINEVLFYASSHVTNLEGKIGALKLFLEEHLSATPPASFHGSVSITGIKSQLDDIVLGATNQQYQWYYPASAVGPEHTFVLEMAASLKDPIDYAVGVAAALVETQMAPLVAYIPSYDSEELKGYLVDFFMNKSGMNNLTNQLFSHFTDIVSEFTDLSGFVFDQVNNSIKDIVGQLENSLNDALESANGVLSDFPMAAGKIDGYAIMNTYELERLHVGAEWEMEGSSDDDTVSYNAALDVTSWNANGKASECLGGVSANGMLDAVISTRDLKIDVGGSEILAKKIYLGFTLENMAPLGVFGGITTEGTLDFETFNVYDPAFAAGIGAYETYVGASASASFESIQLAIAFLVGKTCNLEVLEMLDPQAAEFIILPNGSFTGFYMRGSASIPIYDMGCMARVGVGADAGAWYLFGPPSNIGGLIGGSAYGKFGCLAAIRGSVLLMGQKVGDRINFRGEGFGAAGLGFDCDPGTWTTVSRSRRDSWCGTCDAEFGATYDNGSGWDIDSPSASCLH